MITNSDKRSDIIQAALELIADRGFHDAPMSEIADKAHVAAGTIYRYFENKDVLINELFQDIEEKLIDALLANYPEKRAVKDQFFYVFGVLCRYLISHPLQFRYMEQYFNSPYGISRRRDKLLGRDWTPNNPDVLRRIFQQGISEQVLKDLPAIVLSSLSMGPMLYLIRDHTLGFVDLKESLIREITQACWDAIKR